MPCSDQSDPVPVNKPPKLSRFNGLDVNTWMRFTKSWFICSPPPRTKEQKSHPATFPAKLAEEHIRFFSRPLETVLDPFSGVGTTAQAAAALNRLGIGIEINPEFHRIATDRLSLSEMHILGDSMNAAPILQMNGVLKVHYILTSPPYWNMLSLSRGGVESVHKEREGEGLNLDYGRIAGNLGDIQDYWEFMEKLCTVFIGLKNVLEKDRYITIIAQNIRIKSGEVVPFVYDLTRMLSFYYTFKGERIWCQDNKKLGCWGWPSEFVTNVHHHYCLNFKNDKRS